VLRQRIAAVASADDLRALAERLVVLGTELMDLYHGTLDTGAIAAGVQAQLIQEGRLELDPFRAWVEASGGYALLPLAQDGSRWVLRLGTPPRYAHLHPARYSPHTRRVRASVLKTAVAVLAYVRVHGGDPLNRDILNAARRDYLNLPPLGHDLSVSEGIGSVLTLLRQE
jgi:hypothetical protein